MLEDDIQLKERSTPLSNLLGEKVKARVKKPGEIQHADALADIRRVNERCQFVQRRGAGLLKEDADVALES